MLSAVVLLTCLFRFVKIQSVSAQDIPSATAAAASQITFTLDHGEDGEVGDSAIVAGDFNRDGQIDIVSGPYWYEGPDFKKRHEIYPADKTFTRKDNGKTIEGYEGGLGTNNVYSDNFFAFVYDFNNDGWPDIYVANDSTAATLY